MGMKSWLKKVLSLMGFIGVEKRESVDYDSGGVEEEIERSKVHWSALNVMDGDEEAEVSNVEEFLALQKHPTWGGFFQTFGYDLGDLYKPMGEMVVGKKFAEGGQAELYDCKVKWLNSERNVHDMDDGCEYVLKVFKKGTYLKQLKSQWPSGLLQYHVEDMQNLSSPKPILLPKFQCKVFRGVLLKDGRFAFLMEKWHFDLRHLIHENMKLRRVQGCGPFAKDEGELIMYDVALGVEWLHNYEIVHRDLKASNVLVWEFPSGWPKWKCCIADYECSVGVVGTGFYRAPEILQASKERKLRERPEVFSKASDVYGYGMICYEVLTGKYPYEDYSPNDYDHVLNGQRPLVPHYVQEWKEVLLERCWHSDPMARPCIGDILDVILAHSKIARRREERYKMEYGGNYRMGYHARVSRS